MDVFLRAHSVPPTEIVLDLDLTDDPVHGTPEGRFFHGYYGCCCGLPEDKVSAVRELRPLHVVGGMLGDGANDAPALAAALMADDLTKLPYAVRHAHGGRGTRSASILCRLSG